jgi:hypothetical protein
MTYGRLNTSDDCRSHNKTKKTSEEELLSSGRGIKVASHVGRDAPELAYQWSTKLHWNRSIDSAISSLPSTFSSTDSTMSAIGSTPDSDHSFGSSRSCSPNRCSESAASRTVSACSTDSGIVLSQNFERPVAEDHPLNFPLLPIPEEDCKISMPNRWFDVEHTFSPPGDEHSNIFGVLTAGRYDGRDADQDQQLYATHPELGPSSRCKSGQFYHSMLSNQQTVNIAPLCLSADPPHVAFRRRRQPGVLGQSDNHSASSEDTKTKDACGLKATQITSTNDAENVEYDQHSEVSPLPVWFGRFEPSGRTSSATPESEGENSFVDGWEDHESPSTLDIENEILFTSTCDNLARLLTNAYIANILNSNDNVRQGFSGHRSCTGSDKSAIVSQTSTDTKSASQTTAPSSVTQLTHKRHHDEDDDDDQSQDKGGKRQRLGSFDTEMLDGKLLACPYFKYDPMRYSERNVLEKSYRGCSSCFLKDISRLKQHLYRVHRRPDHYCGRCSEEFNFQDELESHIRASKTCDVRDLQYSEKMTADQLTSIKRRSPGRSPRETWYVIFKILFPASSLPETPFAEWTSPDTIAAFVDHAERRGPAMLSALISTDIQHLPFYTQNERQILDEAIERAFPQVIRELSHHFGRSSSQSDGSSSRSAVASSLVANSREQATTLHEVSSTRLPDTVPAAGDDLHSTSFEPSQLQPDSGLNQLSIVDVFGNQLMPTAGGSPTQSLAPTASYMADFWTSFPGYESQPFDGELQSSDSEIPASSNLSER